MEPQRYFSLAQLPGTEISVLQVFPEQHILVQDSDLGLRLARLLNPEATTAVEQRQRTFWRIAHNRDVDRLLVNLIDLFISIRYAHPAIVQLDLALGEDEKPVRKADEL